ncbi:hypothetical protein H0H92_006751 [Tricholoma furcatifolium]|nr:hypothetical protein H0H92_006751 [Tricholoma furcatifolium]
MALSAVLLLIPLATHIASINGCISHNHYNSSAISLVCNVPGLKAAILAFRNDIVRVKDCAHATTMLSQVQLFFIDEAFYQKLLDIPDVPAAIFQIYDAANFSNPDGIASLTGFANLCEGLRSLQQATAIAKELVKPKPLPCKCIAKTPKFVESDTDSDALYMPGTSSAELLRSKVDALLAAGGSVTHPSLAYYLQVLDKTTQMELFALNISHQTCNSLLQHHEAAATFVSNEDTIMEKVST